MYLKGHADNLFEDDTDCTVDLNVLTKFSYIIKKMLLYVVVTP